MSKIVAGASYGWYDDYPTKESPIEHLPSGVGFGSTHISLYDADGEWLETVEHAMRFAGSFVDPCAPPPRPASYRRIWWPAIDLGDGLRKGNPGYAVLFHDRHGHRIGWLRLESADAAIVSGDFDLTGAVEEPSDFSQKPTAAETEGDGEQESWCRLQ